MAERGLRARLRNGLRLLRGGVSEPYRAPFEVVMRDAMVALRFYGSVGQGGSSAERAVLLVPPLMVTSEIYDISPELSAVAFLTRAGVPTYVADFGAPEAQAGGLDRTLDDHVLAVSRCIDHLVEATGADVHLVGYSQGGMFVYQAAAYRKSAGIASLVTFGAPVDIRRNVPFRLDDRVAKLIVAGLWRVIGRPLEGLRALPGTLSARGFKLMAPLQGMRHLVQLLAVLDDEEALARLEPKRRFLGGEGFIAWPGPALRTFIDEFVVGNRMKQGGFVIAGRTVALADITRPICYVVGEQDDLALPDAVRAIKQAAPRAASYPVHVAAGHFGLVVGRAALSVCWPTVVAWQAWQDGRGPRPAILDSAAAASVGRPEGGVGEALWEQLGRVGVGLGRLADALRWQLPRVVRRALVEAGVGETRVAGILRERAAAAPDEVAFLFAGRAYSFAEVDERVDAVARALGGLGIEAGRLVAVVAHATPDFITMLMALDRVGAVALLVAAGEDVQAELLVVADGDAWGDYAGPIVMVGRGGREAALVVMVVGTQVGVGAGDEEAARDVEWLSVGLAVAIEARLTGSDTVFAPGTLAGRALMVAAAGALVGGARLQIGGAAASWEELQNTGATVLVADEEAARALADAPVPERHVVRLVLGASLASEIAAALVDRLGRRTRYRALPAP